MPWIVGLDEAGYGPTLGPLVQAVVAARVPDGVGCLWERLRRGVRRAGDSDDGRVLIDDSKLVHAGPHGLARLERTIAGTLASGTSIGHFLDCVLCGSAPADLAAEPWYTPDEPIPVILDGNDLAGIAERLAETLLSKRVAFGVVRSVATPAPRFNALLDQWESKSAALEQ